MSRQHHKNFTLDGNGNHKIRTWKTSNTLRQLNKATLHGDVKATLRSLASGFMSTIGEGNLYSALDIPQEMVEDAYEARVNYHGCSPSEAEKFSQNDALSEWTAVNSVDFFNEIQMMYSLVAKYHFNNFSGLKQGFPQGYYYRVKGMDVKTGPEYVMSVFTWIEDLLENQEIFPESTAELFRHDFVESVMSKVYTRLFRVYAIMYATCIPSFKEIQAVKQLNLSFKHFYYFVRKFSLVEKKEFEVLKLPNMKEVIMMGQLEGKFEADKVAAAKKKKK